MNSIAHSVSIEVISNAFYTFMVPLNIKNHFHDCFTMDCLVESLGGIHNTHLRNKTHWPNLYSSRWPPYLACTSYKLYRLSLWWLAGPGSSHPRGQTWLVVDNRKSWFWYDRNQNSHLIKFISLFLITNCQNIIGNLGIETEYFEIKINLHNLT